ncbi:MAG TPA: ABC transporter permease [Gemmatimonadaceae bacterium]|jgi:predicted permease|nr:ABC transporter permease [Gemmatimonadaceae bacterium]
MKRIFRKSEPARDVRDELQFHLEMRAREFMERGMPEAEARDAAARAFGNVEMIDAELSVARVVHVNSRERRDSLRELGRDVVFAARTLRKNRGFTLAALATLALGIGAATSVFTVVDGVLLRPLPYADPGRLAMVWLSQSTAGPADQLPLSTGFYSDAERTGRASFASIAAFRSWPFTLTGGGSGDVEQVSGARVTPSLFGVLGVRPALGHDFTAPDGDSGAAPVAIISHALWQRRFGGDAGVVGRSIELGGTPYKILGVMPADFAFPRGAELPTPLQFGLRTDIWTPLQLSASDRTFYGAMNTSAIARLRPGASLARAHGELSSALQQFLKVNAPKLKLDYNLVTLKDQAATHIRGGLYLLMSAVAFLLFIACANVANLLLARTGARSREFALRTTLGARRSRIAAQLITENVLLAAAGSALGVVLSIWATRAMLALVPGSMPRADDVGIDWRIAGVAALLAIAIGAAFGLAASTQVRWNRVAETLRDPGARATGGRATRFGRRALVVAEVSLSLVLIIGAALLATSFARLQRVDPGFRADGRFTASITLPIGARFDPVKDAAAWARFFGQLDERLAKTPAIQASGAISGLPLSDAAEGGGFAIVGQPTPEPGQAPHTEYFVTQGEYFRAMGIKVVSGRVFDATDVRGGARVAVVNREFARKYFAGAAIGRQIIPYFDFVREPRTIVGVVDDVQYGSLDAPATPEAYVPQQQMSYPGLKIVLRGTGDDATMLSLLKTAVREIDPKLAVSSPRPMTAVVAESLARRRFSMTLIGIFAGAALLLAMVGLYGVIALSVNQRRREIGVRVALGAQRQDVIRLVLGEGLRVTAIGVLLGVVTARVLSTLVASLLYGVSATSPAIYGAAAAIVVVVTLLATYVPALRATRIDPNLALRAD